MEKAGEAARALKAGDLVILPTETVYGLAADAGNARAVARLYEAKGRPRFNPLIAHVVDSTAAERVAHFDDRARALASAFWPGPSRQLERSLRAQPPRNALLPPHACAPTPTSQTRSWTRQ